MVFSALSFLCFFLPWTIALYYFAPRRLRNLVLLAASFVFYLWGAGAFVYVLAGSIAINYVVGYRIERSLLAVGVVVNVGTLAWFKYANFGVDQANGILGLLGEPGLPWAAVILPIGISFFTFHALSYLIDIYRRAAHHLANPIDFALYIAFFPQLIAGPIVRFHDPGRTLILHDSFFGVCCMTQVAAWFADSIWLHVDDLTLHPEVVASLPEYDRVVMERAERLAYLTNYTVVLRPLLERLTPTSAASPR